MHMIIMSNEALNQLMPQSGHAHESPEAAWAASKFEIRISKLETKWEKRKI